MEGGLQYMEGDRGFLEWGLSLTQMASIAR